MTKNTFTLVLDSVIENNELTANTKMLYIYMVKKYNNILAKKIASKQYDSSIVIDYDDILFVSQSALADFLGLKKTSRKLINPMCEQLKKLGLLKIVDSKQSKRSNSYIPLDGKGNYYVTVKASEKYIFNKETKSVDNAENNVYPTFHNELPDDDDNFPF